MPTRKIMSVVLIAVVATATVTYWNTGDAPAQFGGQGFGFDGGGTGDGGLKSSSLIIQPMQGGDSNAWVAFGVRSGTWKRHTFPRAHTVLPTMSAEVCAFAIQGDQIQQLVAVDRNGNWRTHALSEPTDSPCIPSVSASIACYSIDGHVFAFSALTGTWDSIPGTGAVVSATYAVVQDETRIAAFSAHTGRWSVANLVVGENQ